MIFWFDVEDLIVFFEHASRPTGIQRLSFEIYREVWKTGGASGQVRFCRHGNEVADYAVVDWPRLETDILAAIAADRAVGQRKNTSVLPDQKMATNRISPGQAGTVSKDSARRVTVARDGRSIRHRIHDVLFPWIAPRLRTPLGKFYRAQKESVLALKALGTALVGGPAGSSVKPMPPPKIMSYLSSAPLRFEPDDVFVSLGAAWVLANAAAGRDVKSRYGMRFAVLIYDLIPELYPEWTAREGVPIYRTWLHHIVPHADVIFTISQSTSDDLTSCMAKAGTLIPVPHILPIGHRPARPDTLPLVRRPFDRAFVLFVSTIEVRKNHALLFRVWRRLLADLPSEQVPYLVFAGKIGWLTQDLLSQLDNADWLDGHIRHVQSPSEQELAALYESCAFTIFPSLYEGWGLPVTESLSFGKTVAASNRSSIPEAGGAFCSYFDPENLEDAYTVIRTLIENPGRVGTFEREIAAAFRPPGWAESAGILLYYLQMSKESPHTPPGMDG